MLNKEFFKNLNYRFVNSNFTESNDYLHTTSFCADTQGDYTLNSEGFRGKHFEYNSGIVALGCSLTFGVGVDQNDTWPEKLANLMQTDYYNISFPSAGLSLQTLWLLQNQHRINDLKGIFIVMPPKNRLDMIDNNWSHFNLTKELKNEVSKNTETIVNSIEPTVHMNYELCIESCKLLANHHNVPFMVIDKELKNLVQDKARDNEHFGPKTHTAIAKHFFNFIDKY